MPPECSRDEHARPRIAQLKAKVTLTLTLTNPDPNPDPDPNPISHPNPDPNQGKLAASGSAGVLLSKECLLCRRREVAKRKPAEVRRPPKQAKRTQETAAPATAPPAVPPAVAPALAPAVLSSPASAAAPAAAAALEAVEEALTRTPQEALDALQLCVAWRRGDQKAELALEP